MKIWVIMMGFEFILFGLAAMLVVIWMRRPDDHLDDMLREIEQHNSLRFSDKKQPGAK